MRVLMVMFDSLNRDMLEPYGGNLVKTPNFTRMAEHSVTFDNCYAEVFHACRQEENCIREDTIFFTEAGGHWNRLMILCQRF